MDDRTIEFTLIRANLLCSKGRFEEAQKLLEEILRVYPGDPAALKLLARIQASRDQEQDHDSQRRMLRYTLRMDTTWRRVMWYVASLGFCLYCLWFMILSVDAGNQKGFATTITTIQHTRGGPWHYTRPIYVDLLLSGTGILLSIGAVVLVRIVSPGAAQWEELDSSEIRNRWQDF